MILNEIYCPGLDKQNLVSLNGERGLNPADGFSATGLDVRGPQATTILVDSVQTVSNDFFDKTRQPRSVALSSGEESSDVLLPQHFHADGFPAMGIDVHEPQPAGVLANSVTASGEFFDKTWSLRDGADVHDHDQSTVTDTSYNTVDFKPLGRRAANESKVPSPTPEEQAQLDVDANYKFYLEHKGKADKLHDELAGVPSTSWGTKDNRCKINKAAKQDRIALTHLKNAHGLEKQFSLGGLLPDLEQEQARVQDLEAKYQEALANYDPGFKRFSVDQDGQPVKKRRRSRKQNTESAAAAGSIPTDESGPTFLPRPKQPNPISRLKRRGCEGESAIEMAMHCLELQAPRLKNCVG
ncbi:hypothetical protein EV361DRAFT_1032527 [Lentinula raphanica]|nr:hypothetical protein EV361DRAFT_1032527 [Lentinula raphanica]